MFVWSLYGFMKYFVRGIRIHKYPWKLYLELFRTSKHDEKNLRLKKAKARACALTHELVLYVCMVTLWFHKYFVRGILIPPRSTKTLSGAS